MAQEVQGVLLELTPALGAAPVSALLLMILKSAASNRPFWRRALAVMFWFFIAQCTNGIDDLGLGLLIIFRLNQAPFPKVLYVL